MADDEDTPMEETPIRTEDNSSDSDSESDSDEAQVQPVQWLATGREKRKTAGNRLNSLLQAEEPDDELELLFAEDEDDAGFEDEEADSDVQMDSSDDDEDQGPTAGADDLEGEKELQRQNKVEAKAKKKKANLIPKIFKKKLKFDPTVPQAPAPRPKKKSERASWLPTVEDAPTRASAREATQRKKTELIGDLVEREERRKKQLASMEKAAKKKEAAKKPAMTQEDRLREAARVEKQNAKSLSRWEEAEQLREEEQRAKLAALTNRQLNGPVITWWSGKGEYLGGKLKKVGKVLEIEDPKEKSVSRKRKAAEMEADSEIEKTKSPKPALHPPMVLDQAAYDRLASTPATEPKSSATPTPVSAPIPAPVPAPAPTPTPAPPKSTPLAPPNFQMPPQSGPAYQSPLAPPPSFLAPPPALAFDGSHPLPGFHPPLLAPHSQHPAVPPQPQPRLTPYQPNPFSAPPAPTPAPAPAPAPPQPPPPPAIEHTVRNYLILSNFDEVAIKDKNVQTQILFGRKFTKVQKTTPTQCAIFSYPAKFRDPVTGLPYCNTYAYKEIQKLRKGDYKWSGLLGAYVGQGTYAARGVPPRFMGGVVKAGGSAAPADTGDGNVNVKVDGVAGAKPS